MKRAGAVSLSLLSAPLNVHLLRALEEGPLALIDLRRAVGSPPQSTMRVYSRTLVEIGYQGYMGLEFIPTRNPDEGLAEAVGVCDV